MSTHTYSGCSTPDSVSITYTVMLVDAHEMVRQGIELGLSKEPDLEVIGSFGTGRELVEALERGPADIVVMDFTLGPTDIDGLSLIQTLHRRFRQCKIIVVAANNTAAIVSLAFKAGSWGVVDKTQKLTELIAAIRTVALGRVYLHPCMVPTLQGLQRVVDNATLKPVAELSTPWRLNECLSPKEHEVLRCFLDGLSVSAIAAKFSRSVSTISTQKQSAYRKLGVKTDSELFKFAQHFGRL